MRELVFTLLLLGWLWQTCVILSLKSVVNPSTFLPACTFVSITLHKQQAPRGPHLTAHRHTWFCLFICLLTYSLLCYWRKNLAIKTRMASICPPSAVVSQVLRFQAVSPTRSLLLLASIIYLVRLSLIPCLKKCQDIPTAGISYPLVCLFWNLLCRTLSSSKIHFHTYQGLVNSRQTFNHLIMFHIFCMDLSVSAEGHVEQYLAHQFSQHTVCPLGAVVYASLGFHLYSAAQGREGNKYIRNFSCL